MSTRERYNSIYSSTQEHVFERGKPEKYVTRIPEHKRTGTVLDLGAGDGRNSLFLASKGFNVSALDFSEVAIEKLKKCAAENGISLEADVGDALQWSPKEEYDVIILTFVLQHLLRQDALRLLEKIQEHTNPDGLNSLAIFTKNGDFFRKNQRTDMFYPGEGWLKEFYTDWDILEYDESERASRAKKPDGTPMRNVVASILARKRL